MDDDTTAPQCNSCGKPLVGSRCPACMMDLALGGSDDASGSGSVEQGDDWVLGKFRIIRRIGAGGMGVVYLAEQQKPLKRMLALKVLRRGIDTEEVILRFDRERQVLAMMDHPHIAKVHEAGVTDEGRPFFAMELVEGQAITEFCKQNNLGTPERIQLFIDLCAAIEHAHHKGVIHRDIKPSNVLVSEQGEIKVIDFGISKAIAGQANMDLTWQTRHGQVLGTPGYMAPEQLGGGKLADMRADVYSLGCMLYELITDHAPFPKEKLESLSFREMETYLINEEPMRPSRCSGMATKLVRNLRGDLEWVILKAMCKQPERRYASVSSLIDDLIRYQESRTVSARAPSMTYQIHKFMSRHKKAVAVTIVLLMAVLGGLGFGLYHTAKMAKQKEAGDVLIAYVFDELLWDLRGLGRDEVLDSTVEQCAAYLDETTDSENLTGKEHWVYGRYWYQRGRTLHKNEEADRALVRALEHLSQSEGIEEGELNYRIAEVTWGRAWYALQRGDLKVAKQFATTAAKKMDAVVKSYPSNALWKMKSRSPYRILCLVAIQEGNWGEAKEYATKTSTVVDEMKVSFPADLGLKEGRKDSLEFLSMAHLTTHSNESLRYALEALELMKEIARENMNGPHYRSGLGVSYGIVADAYEANGKFREARDRREKSINIYRSLIKDVPSSVPWRRLCVAQMKKKAESLAKEGREEEAKIIVLEAEKILNEELE